MTPAAVRDALLRRALEVRPSSRWSAAWLADASLVALGWYVVDGETRLAPGTVDDVAELVRVAGDVDPSLVAWASRMLRQVARPAPRRPRPALASPVCGRRVAARVRCPVCRGPGRVRWGASLRSAVAPLGVLAATCLGCGWHFSPRPAPPPTPTSTRLP